MSNFNAVKAKNDCVQWIREWFDKNGFGCNAVIGISGGKDSSVVAALCVEALGKDRVIGIKMPCGEQPDIGDSNRLIQHLGIKSYTVNIWDAIIGLDNQFPTDIEISKQNTINLPPRIRMATLYAISQSVNGRVVGTDNASEAYIGYSTRWGDNVADLMPILNFTSEEVVTIGDALGLPYELTHKIPSDGLCGKTDEDNFGFTYEALNKYIRTGEWDDDVVKEKIDWLHKKNLFKTQPIPSFVPMGVFSDDD
jgi:NAD+ synthase